MPEPFAEKLDCADPSLQVERRNETLTAVQALALLNNKFMVRMAEHFAARVEKQAADLPGQVTAAHRLALGRSPTPEELRVLTELARKQGLAQARRRLGVRGRPGVHPQHGVALQRPRAGNVPASDRLCAAGLSRHGGVDQLRPGPAGRQPADLRGAARPTRLPAQRAEELGQRLPPRRASGHDGPAQRPHAHRGSVPPAESGLTRAGDAELLAALEKINRKHEQDRPGDSRLDARIRSYELAAKMQLIAPEVLDLSKEPAAIRKMYGLDSLDIAVKTEVSEKQEIQYFGRNCLVARRLLERGVRFVQIWSGADNGFPRRNWDSHEDIARDHWPLGRGMATGAAALLKDLKQRGMLDDTLVLWTTEFGRMPCSQGSKGRDHNPFVFTNWLAGGGIKGGISHRPSDEWSYKPAEPQKATACYDVHATMLHLLGIDHEKLTVRHNGIDRRLTDVHGKVIQELLA